MKKAKKKYIGIGMILAGLVLLVSPNFLALIGGFTQNSSYQFDICSKCFGEPYRLNLVGNADQAIDKLNITLGFSAVPNSLYGSGVLVTSIMQVFGNDRYIGSINLINLNDRDLVTNADISLWDGKTNSYIFQFNGEKMANLSFVFEESNDAMGARLFIKSVEYTARETTTPPEESPWIPLPITTPIGQFNLLGLVFIGIGGILVVKR